MPAGGRDADVEYADGEWRANAATGEMEWHAADGSVISESDWEAQAEVAAAADVAESAAESDVAVEPAGEDDATAPASEDDPTAPTGEGDEEPATEKGDDD